MNLSAETVLIDGPDAIAFAHAQFSSRVTSLALKQWQFSAWLDHQGRVRALFHLARLADDRLLLLLRGGTADSLSKALQPYVFRSKLTLTAAPQSSLTTAASMPLFEVQQMNDEVVLGCDTHGLSIRTGMLAEGQGDDTWRLSQLREGWPWLPDNGLNKWLSPSLSLQRLQAVVIDKGCYPGQEIVARMHYRGGSKRHLHSVEMSHPCTPGESLHLGEQAAGFVVDVLPAADGLNALVILNDELVQSVHDRKLGPFGNGMSMKLCQRWEA